VLSYAVSQAAFEHSLAALVLVARLGDIGSTYLATPRLVLEANPIARRLGWPFALLTLLLAFVPYYNTAAGVLVLVPSLLVASRNFGSIWLVRALGEDRMLALQVEAARRRRFSEAFLCGLAESGFLALAAALLMILSGGARRWAFVFALGVLVWAIALLVHRTAHLRRIFRLAREAAPSQQLSSPL
jgi:hypothetical protein